MRIGGSRARRTFYDLKLYGSVKAMTVDVVAFFHAVIIGADNYRKGSAKNGYIIKI